MAISARQHSWSADVKDLVTLRTRTVGLKGKGKGKGRQFV